MTCTSTARAAAAPSASGSSSARHRRRGRTGPWTTRSAWRRQASRRTAGGRGRRGSTLRVSRGGELLERLTVDLTDPKDRTNACEALQLAAGDGPDFWGHLRQLSYISDNGEAAGATTRPQVVEAADLAEPGPRRRRPGGVLPGGC